MVNASEQIEKFKEFIEAYYSERIGEILKTGTRSLTIDFSELKEFDYELAESLLNEPEESLKAAELSLEHFDVSRNVRVRITNLPKSQFIFIRDIRSENLNQLVLVEGIVRLASDVRPQVVSAKFECPGCGNMITMLQIDSKFKEPFRCSCGRKGKFRMVNKELVDAQRLVIEEAPESLEGGEQPKRISVFLKENLVEPKMEKKTTPGSKVRIVGIIREIQKYLKTGVPSTAYDLVIDCNNLEPVEEAYEEINVSKEEEEKIFELSKNPMLNEKFINSLAPSVFGHELIKEALVLQLFGGIRKVKSDGTTARGDMHVLLVGDPGCIAGDSQVALFYKGMEKIKNLGNRHLEPINEIITKIRKSSKDRHYGVATVFQKYPKQPVLRVVTETGKEIICTYNQPFLTKDDWKRVDEIEIGTKIRVMPKIPNNIKRLADTGFISVKRKTGPLKEVLLPNKFTPELAALCGYITGDGNIHPSGYKIACYINNEETDLIEQLSGFWRKTFNIGPVLYIKNFEGGELKTIDNGNGLLRQFVSMQQMNIQVIHSRQVTQALSFLSIKRVPQQIFKSPNHVIAKFISWLFEADGCAFGKGRGRTSIQLKSATPFLLKDVQLLLLYFGIQSRIIGDNLCIRRSRDMELFAKHIGFNSKKKKEALNKVLESIKNKSDVQKRKHPQRWERIVSIMPEGIMEVYDFEVPIDHSFIANGIVCHNSAKSTMLMSVSKVAPKGRFVSGKGASAAGITASVIRDEFLRGWALEAGAMVLANKGIAVIDELDKMSPEDRDALHEAMEQQRISIAKANIQATLRCETTILAAANPKLGRFDMYTPIAKQIDLPPTLINRFDLIFPVRDIPNKDKDERIASHVLKSHQEPASIVPEIPIPLLRKYIAYAKQNIIPRLSDSAIDEIKKFYVELRNQGDSGNEDGRNAVPISARQLEALVRLSEASAKSRLSNVVTRQDAKRAINLLRYCLMQVGYDYETGKIDIDLISTGIAASKRSKAMIVKDIIGEIEGRGAKTISLDELTAVAAERGIRKEQLEEIIELLRKNGEIFEPRRGFIARVN